MEKNPPPPPPAAAAAAGELTPMEKNQPSLPPPSAAAGGDSRDFLLHLESYLARRDGVDKLLKISRYAAKIALASGLPPETLAPRLRAFESSVGLSRKAFRLGKFVQDLNALRASSPALLAVLAYGGEGVYYFLEQIVWLSKSGLIPSTHSKLLQKLSAWAELVGYAGSIAIKVCEVRRIQSAIRSLDGVSEKALKEKLLLKQLSVVQDLADAMMALGDVTDGKGLLGDPLLLASAGMVSALISAQKNWAAC